MPPTTLALLTVVMQCHSMSDVLIARKNEENNKAFTRGMGEKCFFQYDVGKKKREEKAQVTTLKQDSDDPLDKTCE